MSIENRGHIQPLVLKFGAALALSLGGIQYNYLRRKKIKPSKSSPPPSQDSLDTGERDSGGAKNDDNVLFNSSSVGAEKHESSLSGSPTKSCQSDNYSPGARSNGEKDELHRLRDMVKILKERERDLEIRLLEYYGLKEQETAAMELQNRLIINDMEAKLFKLKIESLEADKKRLEEQVSDHVKVSTAHDEAKAKIKILKRTMRYEAEQNRKQIVALQDKVAYLQAHEHEDVAANRADIQAKLQTINHLEKEAEELKKINNSLSLENSELSQKLDYVNLIATTVLDDDEKTSVIECQRLKEELLKEIERLQTDHSSDMEELVYLRLLNACFRHQLRHQSPRLFCPGEQLPGQNSTTGSTKPDEKGNSCVTDSGEDSSSVDLSSSDKTHRHIKRR